MVLYALKWSDKKESRAQEKSAALSSFFKPSKLYHHLPPFIH